MVVNASAKKKKIRGTCDLELVYLSFEILKWQTTELLVVSAWLVPNLYAGRSSACVSSRN